MSSSKTFLAGVAGLAAGLAIGMLFAPAKGTKTRKRLKKRIMGLADMYENELMGSMDHLEETGEEIPVTPETKEQVNK